MQIEKLKIRLLALVMVEYRSQMEQAHLLLVEFLSLRQSPNLVPHLRSKFATNCYLILGPLAQFVRLGRLFLIVHNQCLDQNEYLEMVRQQGLE